MFSVTKEWIKNNMLDGIPICISNQNGEYFMKGYTLDIQLVEEIISEFDGRIEKFQESFCAKIFFCPDLPSNEECRRRIKEIQLEKFKF